MAPFKWQDYYIISYSIKIPKPFSIIPPFSRLDVLLNEQYICQHVSSDVVIGIQLSCDL